MEYITTKNSPPYTVFAVRCAPLVSTNQLNVPLPGKLEGEGRAEEEHSDAREVDVRDDDDVEPAELLELGLQPHSV